MQAGFLPNVSCLSCSKWTLWVVPCSEMSLTTLGVLESSNYLIMIWFFRSWLLGPEWSALRTELLFLCRVRILDRVRIGILLKPSSGCSFDMSISLPIAVWVCMSQTFEDECTLSWVNDPNISCTGNWARYSSYRVLWISFHICLLKPLASVANVCCTSVNPIEHVFMFDAEWLGRIWTEGMITASGFVLFYRMPWRGMCIKFNFRNVQWWPDLH